MIQKHTLISQLMTQLTPQMKRIFKQAEERWAVLFASCPLAQSIDSSAVSHLIAGRRIISRQYITTYADPSHPRAPILLSQDLKAAIEAMWPTFSERAELFSTLIAFIRTNIDPIDQPDLLPHELPNSHNLDTTTLLMTSVVWYCICHDHSQI